MIICSVYYLLLYSSQYWQLDFSVQLLWVENQATALIHFNINDKHIFLFWLWFILLQILCTWLSFSVFMIWNSNYNNNQLSISFISSYISFISWHLTEYHYLSVSNLRPKWLLQIKLHWSFIKRYLLSSNIHRYWQLKTHSREKKL